MDLENRYKDYCTVQNLIDFIKEHNIPMDSKILVQRVEDVYYEGVDISGMGGADTPDGIYPKGSKADGWKTHKKMQGDDEVEYSPVWCAVNYEDEKHLFLDLHY